MNVAATISMASAALAVYVGLLSRRIAAAPGSRDQRRFWVAAFASASYGLCNLPSISAAAPHVVVFSSRVQVASAFLLVWGWLRYAQAFLERRPGRLERAWALALLAGAALTLVPGLVYGGAVVDRPYPAFGVVYREAVPTPFGTLVIGAAVAGAIPIVVIFLRAWRAGVTHAGILAAAFGLVLLLGANDALSNLGVLDTPYLLDLGFAAPVLAVGWVITGRFVESARALERLRGQLLADVEARTKDLATALDALHQAEKLAAVGQFANGVAHEVNSPASVVMANLRYLEEAIRAGAFPNDTTEVVADALGAMKRINDLVRKLVDAGRIAATPGAATTVPVAEVVAKVTEDARPRLGRGVELTVKVPEGLFVRARREALEQVLTSLLANATEAIPPERAGRIDVRAERSSGAVRIAVADDGSGMGPEVLRRALDPFFTTKSAGHGSGLGLSVARGLVEAHGGVMWLESSPGVGTTAFVELAEATPPAAR